jgi:hypothetical protein
MDIDWRFVAVCAGIAFVFSFVAGIFGGVRFGTLLARAFIGAAVFGTVGAGVYYLIKSRLPELLSADGAGAGGVRDFEDVTNDGSDEAEASAEPGAIVDIVVGEDEVSEMPSAGSDVSDDEPAELESVDEEGEGEGEGEAEEFSSLSATPSDSDDSDNIPASYDGFVEEVREGLPPDEGGVDGESDDDDEIQELESVDDEPSEMSSVADGTEEAPAAVAGDGSIDILPDMDDFGGTFGSEVSEKAASGNASDGMPVDVMGEQHSTSEIVKAIQTVMKKDEKG